MENRSSGPEYATKIERLIALMSSQNLDAVAMCGYQNVAYFGGTYLITQSLVPDRQAFVVVQRNGETSLVACNIESRCSGRVLD